MPTNTTTLITLHEPAPTHPPTRTSFGRGGAGNRTVPTPHSLPLPPTTIATPDARSTHSATQNAAHYSTGRGGVGNMHGPDEERRMFSFDEELAREGKVGAVPVYHVGRGGQGNKVVEGAGRKGSEASEASGSGRRSLEWVWGMGGRRS